jgi:cell fate regulator YaaT (PSP1 superfamily)
MSNDVVGVRFQHGATKIYSYRLGYLMTQIRLGDQVVVETKDGQDIGKVVMLGPLRGGKKRDGALKNVVRRATPRDLVLRHWYRRREGDALLAARKLITEQRLPLKAVKAEFAYDGSRMTLHVQPHDEKEENLNVSKLCEEIGRQYKTRVGVRRIGPRDASQLLGGHGLCGGEKCCTLVGVGQVSIDMAKQQNIAMNQPDAIGLCGRLRCCLRFEAQDYKEARADHPKIGAVVTTPQGKGQIVAIDVLAEVLTIVVGSPEEHVTIKMLLTELEQSDPNACPRCGKKENADAGTQGNKDGAE